MAAHREGGCDGDCAIANEASNLNDKAGGCSKHNLPQQRSFVPPNNVHGIMSRELLDGGKDRAGISGDGGGVQEREDVLRAWGVRADEKTTVESV